MNYRLSKPYAGHLKCKVSTIKAIRKLTRASLKEAKALSETFTDDISSIELVNCDTSHIDRELMISLDKAGLNIDQIDVIPTHIRVALRAVVAQATEADLYGLAHDVLELLEKHR